MTYRAKDNHRPCACGAELADECAKCMSRNPLGAFTITPSCPGCPFKGCNDCPAKGGVTNG